MKLSDARKLVLYIDDIEDDYVVVYNDTQIIDGIDLEEDGGYENMFSIEGNDTVGIDEVRKSEVQVFKKVKW